MEIQELEAKITALENEVSFFKDIETIRRLQKSYGYYVEHLMVDELAELWSDDGELQWMGWRGRLEHRHYQAGVELF
jgi:hypothetical protein